MASSKGVCVVVGAGPGLGGSCALKFAKQGFKIAAMNRTAESFAPTEAKLKELGATFAFYATDCTDKSSVAASFAKAKADLGNVDVLVYNAGGGGFGIKPLDIDPDAFVKSFEVSCLGALLCSQAVLPDMLAKSGSGSEKKGTLLFSSATSAFRGSEATAQFACGKFALRALSQSLAKAYAKEGIHACHIRLDCILATPSYRERFSDAYEAGKLADTDEIAETYYQLHLQSMLALSNEIDIRPNQEGWSC